METLRLDAHCRQRHGDELADAFLVLDHECVRRGRSKMSGVRRKRDVFAVIDGPKPVANVLEQRGHFAVSVHALRTNGTNADTLPRVASSFLTCVKIRYWPSCRSRRNGFVADFAQNKTKTLPSDGERRRGRNILRILVTAQQRRDTRCLLRGRKTRGYSRRDRDESLTSARKLQMRRLLR